MWPHNIIPPRLNILSTDPTRRENSRRDQDQGACNPRRDQDRDFHFACKTETRSRLNMELPRDVSRRDQIKSRGLHYSISVHLFHHECSISLCIDKIFKLTEHISYNRLFLKSDYFNRPINRTPSRI